MNREDMRSRLILPILLSVTAAIAAAAPAHAVEVGVVKSLDHTVPAAETTRGLKAGWIRLWADWQSAEPAQGQWRPDVIHNFNHDVQQAKAQGLKVLMVVVNSPGWASGGKGGITPPHDPADFGR